MTRLLLLTCVLVAVAVADARGLRETRCPPFTVSVENTCATKGVRLMTYSKLAETQGVDYCLAPGTNHEGYWCARDWVDIAPGEVKEVAVTDTPLMYVRAWAEADDHGLVSMRMPGEESPDDTVYINSVTGEVGCAADPDNHCWLFQTVDMWGGKAGCPVGDAVIKMQCDEAVADDQGYTIRFANGCPFAAEVYVLANVSADNDPDGCVFTNGNETCLFGAVYPAGKDDAEGTYNTMSKDPDYFVSAWIPGTDTFVTDPDTDTWFDIATGEACKKPKKRGAASTDPEVTCKPFMRGTVSAAQPQFHCPDLSPPVDPSG